MALQNAIKFIVKASKDRDFRMSFYDLNSEDIYKKLADEKMEFTYNEFEDAVSSMLFKAQFEEQANTIRQIEGWYKYLIK